MKKFLTLILLLTSLAGYSQSNQVLLPAVEHGKWGYINVSGQWVIQPQFDQCLPFEGRGYTWAEKNGRSYFIDESGNIETELDFNNVSAIYDPIIIYKEEGKWGMYNRIERIHVRPKYYGIWPIEGTDNFLVLDSLVGVLTPKGEQFIPCKYNTIERNSSFYECHIQDQAGLYNDVGEHILYDSFTRFQIFNQFIAGYNDLESLILYDFQGHQLGSGQIERIEQKTSDYFVIRKKGRQFLLRATTFSLVDSLSNQYELHMSRFLLVHSPSGSGLYSVVNHKFVLKKQYSSILALPTTNHIIGNLRGNLALFDSMGNRLTDHEYELIGDFNEWGVSQARKNGKWGLINQKGQQVLPFAYTSIAVGDDQIVKAKTDSTMSLFEFTDQLGISDSLLFNNTASINLVGRIKMGGRTNDPDQNSINPALLNNPLPTNNWFQDREGKWGLKNASGAIFIKPVFDEIKKIRGTAFVVGRITSRRSWHLDHNVQLTAYSRYAVVDEIRFRKMTPLNLLFVDEDNLADSSLGVFRILQVPGFFSTVDKVNGRIYSYGSRYMSAFSEGYARVFVGTKLYTTKRKPTYPVVTTVARYENEFNVRANKNAWYTIMGSGYWAIIGSDGKYITTKNFFKAVAAKSASNVRNNRAILMTKDSLYGLLSSKGNWILQPEYHNISFLEGSNDSLLKLEIHKTRYGYVRTSGEVIAAPNFISADDFHQGWAWASNDGLTHLINAKGGIQKSEQLFKTVSFSEGYGGIARGRKFAVVDTAFNQTTDFIYTKMGMYSEGLVPLRLRGKYGYASVDGSFQLQPAYSKANSFSHGLAVVKPHRVGKSSSYGYIDKNGFFVVKPKYTKAQDLNDLGFGEVRKGSDKGIINRVGRTIVPAKYKKLFYNEGYYVGYSGRKTVVYDTTGKRLFSTRGKAKFGVSEECLVLQRRNKYGVVDMQGKKILPYKYWNLKPFENGISVTTRKSITDIITLTDDTLATVKGIAIGGFSDGRLLMRHEREFRYVDTRGEDLFNRKYMTATPFSKGLAIVKTDGKSGLIDVNGYYRILPAYDRIFWPSEGISKVAQNKMVGVCDLNSRMIVAPDCNTIDYDPSNNIYTFSFKNQLGYFDKQGQIIWDVK